MSINENVLPVISNQKLQLHSGNARKQMCQPFLKKKLSLANVFNVHNLCVCVV